MKANIKKMYWISFFSGMSFLSAVLMPFFIEWGGLTYTQTLFLQSWFMIWGFILEVPAGAVADMLGRKQSIVIGFLVNALAAITYGLIPNFYVFMLAEFLFALALALISGADKALVYDSLKNLEQVSKSEKVYGRMASYRAVGFVIGPVIGSFIGQIGYNWPMLLNSLPLTVAVIIALSLKEPFTEAKTKLKGYWGITKKGLKTLFKHDVLKILAFDFIITSVFLRFILWLYQPALAKTGVEVFYYGMIISLFNLISIPLLSSIHKIEDKLGIKKTIMGSGLIAGSLMIGMALTTNWLLMVVMIIIFFSIKIVREPIYQHYMNYYIDSDVRATTLSSIAMLRKLLTAALYPIIGLLVDWGLDYALLIIGGAILLLTITTRVSKELIS